MNRMSSCAASHVLAMRLRRQVTSLTGSSTSGVPNMSALTAAFAHSARSFSSTGNNNNKSSSSSFVLWKGDSRPRITSLRAPMSSTCAARTSLNSSSSNALWYAWRHMTARGKDNSSKPEGEEEPKPKQEEEENGEEKTEGDKKNQKKKKPAPKKKSFMDHIRGLKDDYYKFPDIYNSANLINFIIFTVFCLCSTGSSTEEAWWLKQWGVDNTFRPHTWFLHSFLTNNFTAMAYAMMLLHTLCHTMLPAMGSRNLLLFICSTATISGAIMWAANAMYYGTKALDGEAAVEKQFGPWDVVHALFLLQYFHYGINPVHTISSFSGWVKYAMWVGEICILYFDWQPTVVGTAVGFALLKTVPQFRVVMAAAK